MRRSLCKSGKSKKRIGGIGMHRIVVLVGVLALTLVTLATPASAEPGNPQTRGWEPITPPQPARSAKDAKAMKGPIPYSHDPFTVAAATSGAGLTRGPHENWLSLDYAATSGADTLVWSNNKGVSGNAVFLGTYPVWTVTNGCPDYSTSFSQFSHNEYAIRITATWTDGVGNLWTFQNENWHMGSYSTGTKASGASFGTQATHPIGGCKYYYAPGQSYHGVLATTGPHIHHYAWPNTTTYQTGPIKMIWTMLSH
jgi:hypothetical protein